jgi:hypothetical protein
MDLTIDGWALVNSKAAIPDDLNPAIMRAEAEIFYENAHPRQNTVNDALPSRPAG